MSTSAEWVERGLSRIAKTYGRYPIVPVRGQGCTLTDADGKTYLDFLAGVAVNNLGHCHPKVVKALQNQAETLIHCSNFYHIPGQIELAEKLCEHSFGDRVFFCNSGAEANEAAIKLARKYNADQGNPGRCEVITATASFHGRTLAMISATGQDKMRDGFAPNMPGFNYVPFGDINALSEAIVPRTCAIMLEPIQGEGGIHVAPPDYLQQVRELCDRHDLLLIFDEVQTGMGRTGTLFAYQHDQVEPDIMTLAKALAGGAPIGTMITREEYADVLGPGTHGSTFGGNPLVAAAGLATFAAIFEEKLLDNCRHMGTYLTTQLEQLKDRYACIQEVRGRGLMIGLQLTIEGGPLVKQAMEQGLLINCTAGNVLRFVPPLVVTKDDIDPMISILDRLFSDVEKTHE